MSLRFRVINTYLSKYKGLTITNSVCRAGVPRITPAHGSGLGARQTAPRLNRNRVSIEMNLTVHSSLTGLGLVPDLWRGE